MIREENIKPALRATLGIELHRLLGTGKSGAVYEVSHGSKGRAAGKVFARSTAESQREFALASWAHSRGIGPCVHSLCSTTEEGPAVLLMEKMDGTLAEAIGGTYVGARLAWALAFRMLASADFSFDNSKIYPSSGWLCCDDLKPDNFLVKKRKHGTELRLGDWDPLHWQPLPLQAREGRWLNRTVLILNSVLACARTSRGKMRFLQISGLWPDAELGFLACLSTLAQEKDPRLASFLKHYDGFLSRGPYHYANVQGGRRRERAGALMEVLHQTYASCFPSSPPPSDSMLQKARRGLRAVTRTECEGRGAARPPVDSPTWRAAADSLGGTASWPARRPTNPRRAPAQSPPRP